MALADGVGCARRGGRVECWGPLVRNGWVVWRARPVRVDGVASARAIAGVGGLVCALDGGAVRRLGVGARGTRHPAWRAVPSPGRATHLGREGDVLRAETAAHGRWRRDDVGDDARPIWPWVAGYVDLDAAGDSSSARCARVGGWAVVPRDGGGRGVVQRGRRRHRAGARVNPAWWRGSTAWPRSPWPMAASPARGAATATCGAGATTAPARSPRRRRPAARAFATVAP